MAKEKILIVDDEQLIRWTFTEALRSWAMLHMNGPATIRALQNLN
ncbi:MAG TPA: response regulator [Blastocatellia bacterium]|nr:response regulator [Blastocatellia bacterium]